MGVATPLFKIVMFVILSLGNRQSVFHHHGADLCDPEQIQDLFRFTQEKFSRSPDILVNNAGQKVE